MSNLDLYGAGFRARYTSSPARGPTLYSPFLLNELPPLPAVEHYSDQWADGYRCAMQDVLNYLKSDGKSQIVQWTEGMLAALTASKP